MCTAYYQELPELVSKLNLKNSENLGNLTWICNYGIHLKFLYLKNVSLKHFYETSFGGRTRIILRKLLGNILSEF